MKNRFAILLACLAIISLTRCGNSGADPDSPKSSARHHLNIPEKGIQSMMEANTQKTIEGTDGSVVVSIGEVTRKKADISIRRGDKILDERILAEHDHISFDYEGISYTLELHNIRKPLLGAGKAEISIH